MRRIHPTLGLTLGSVLFAAGATGCLDFQSVYERNCPGPLCLVSTHEVSVAALHDVGGTSATDVWAFGDFGTVSHYDGSAWQSENFPLVDYTVWTGAVTETD